MKKSAKKSIRDFVFNNSAWRSPEVIVSFCLFVSFSLLFLFQLEHVGYIRS